MVSSFAQPDVVRSMGGNPDTDEVTDDQLTIICNTADSKVKTDTNISDISEGDGRLPLLISAANKQGAILVRLGWNDREQRLPVLRDLYDSDIKSINMGGLGSGTSRADFVASTSYKSRRLSGDITNYYLSTF